LCNNGVGAVLGSGKFAKVYKAVNKASKKVYAIKVTVLL
jgi:serine/threonine protein kinase